jgi:hypothetical protein
MSSLSGNKSAGKLQNKKMIVLDTFYDYFAANLARRKLQLQGIESFLEEDPASGVNFFGNILLKIASKDLKDAFRILSE